MYLFDNLWFVDRLESIYQPLNRSISENPDCLGEKDCPGVLVVIKVGNHFLDDVGECCLLHCVLEDPLDSDVARLEDPGTSTRNIPEENPGVIITHPVTEFL